MKNLNKYINKAIEHQNQSDKMSFNNEYNLSVFGTTKEVMALVAKARWDISGFQKLRITKKQFLEWHRVYLINNIQGG